MLPSRQKIKTDVQRSVTRRRGNYHVTTSDYFKLYVSKIYEMVPDSTLQIELKDKVLLNSMTTPVFGSAKLRHILYFVPFRLIQKSWNSFINGEIHHYEDSAIIPKTCRQVYMSDLCKMFYQTNWNFGVLANRTEITEQTTRGDFAVYGTAWSYGTALTYQGLAGFTLTDKGRQIWNLLYNLGYRLDFCSNGDYKVSAMPILALAKIYIDHLKNTQYNNIEDYNKVEIILNRNSSTNQDISTSDCEAIFNLFLQVNYDSDRFVSAFDNASSPNGGNDYVTNDFVINDINRMPGQTQLRSKVEQMENGTPFLSGVNNLTPTNYPSRPTQYILNALHRLSDFMVRHQIVGHNKLQNYLAQFGVTLTDEQLNKVRKIGMCDNPIQFDEIFSTADTTGASLGMRAGRGYGVNAGKFEVKTNEFGYMIDLAIIVPKVSYYQGQRPHVGRVGRLQFWNPTFDGLGNTAIPQQELIIPTGTEFSPTEFGDGTFETRDKVFGFFPQYYGYKVDDDELSGEFVQNSRNRGMDSWHLFRYINPTNFDNLNFVHSFGFTETVDREQYDRAFATSKSDNFMIITNYNMLETSSKKDLYDTYDYESVGKELEVDIAGTNHITGF